MNSGVQKLGILMDIHNIQLSNHTWTCLIYYHIVLMFSIFVLTLSLITKLQAFWYFTIGSLFTFLVSVSISWSHILEFIFPKGSSTTYFYIITFIYTLLITFIYFCFSVARYRNQSCTSEGKTSLVVTGMVTG